MSRDKGEFDCCRVHVSGRVQGVGFRMAARAEARRLGLRGYAANLADGRVEVVAYGPRASVADLLAWLGKGPSAARVDGVTESLPAPGETASLPREFEIR